MSVDTFFSPDTLAHSLGELLPFFIPGQTDFKGLLGLEFRCYQRPLDGEPSIHQAGRPVEF